MSDLNDLLMAVAGQHRVTFYAQNGEFGGTCVCGWAHHSTRDQVNVMRLIEQVVLAALLHTDAREDAPDSSEVAATQEP